MFTIANNFIISLISTVSTFVLVFSLNFLTNSKDKLMNIFRKIENNSKADKIFKINIKSKRKIYEELNIVFRILRIKIIIYIILEFLIILFFFYYIIAFCEVYKETQNSWLFDSFISFLLSIIIELLISFVMTILYSISLKINIQFLYQFVMFLYRIG